MTDPPSTTVQESFTAKDDPSVEVSTATASSAKKGKKRPMCERCRRPCKVCICESLPKSPIALKKCHLLVLQHPQEAKRHNRSLPLVQLCLSPDNVTVAISRRFGDQVDPSTLALLQNPKVLLVFPAQEDIEVANHDSNQSISLSQAKEFCDCAEEQAKSSSKGDKIVIVILDATWKFAKEMDKANLKTGQYPSHMRRLALSWDDPLRPAHAVVPKRFDIRTAPSQAHLSTAECIAWILSALEDDDKDDAIYDTLMKPLDCMVAKWHDCRKNATENHQPSRRKKLKSKEQERDFSYYGNPEHANAQQQVEETEEDKEPADMRASFFTMGDDDRGGSKKRRRKG